MNKVLCAFICIVTLLSTTLAYADDYKFDPKDPHHFLYIPDGKGPFPAILLLHASTGVVAVNQDWAELLKSHGYVVYIIDSFKPRGWSDRGSVGWDIATAAQLSDVTPAYQYLSQLPFVDLSRIGLLGFSMGGFDVLRIRESVITDDFHKLPFKAAVSFYGVCHRLLPNTTLKGQTAIFIGSEDDRSTTNDCKRLVNVSNNESVLIKIYDGALHGFDNYEFPPSKEVIDERGEHYHIGFDPKSRQQALQDLTEYFDTYLK